MTRSRGRRLAALALAGAVVAGCAREEASRRVMVELAIELPPETEKVPAAPLPPRIAVTVRGPREQVERLRAGDAGPIALDLRSAPARIDLSAATVPLPAGLEVVTVDPAALDLRWDEILTRDVPLQLTAINTPLDGFVLAGELAPSPTTVRVRGPKTLVERLAPIATEPFDLQGLAAGKHVQRVAIERPAPPLVCEGLSVEITATVVRFGKR